MKKFTYLFLLAVSLSLVSKASPGDTTWVQANNTEFTHNPGVSTDWYGNYDTAVAFPSGSTTYRKIFMIFTLGKYTCPAGAQYCAQWDYTVQNYLMTPTGDTLEIGRLITAFAGAGDPNTPTNWSHQYIFDVTDYAAKLQGSAAMRMFFSGYSGGFTGNIRFAFIEGTPERNVVGLQRLWNGSFQFGNSANPINTHFPVVSATAPTGTQSADVKFTVTGHGSDENECCEFVYNTNYYVSENSNQIDQYQIYRGDCGYNEVYPQTGTWIYNRGNWCPGAMVYPNFHTLQNITAGTNFTTDIQFSSYTSTGGGSGYGSYTTEAHLIYYGGFNKTLDASIEDIISPTNNANYFRENPLQGTPVILVRNSGSTTITSISFQYGVQGTSLSAYTWEGSLAPLHDTEITLPEVWDIRTLAGTTGLNTFTAQITQVNGQTDNDATDDKLISQFIAGPQWPVNFIMTMKTNNEGTNGLNSGTSETTWQIFDAFNNVVASNTTGALSTLYNDTLTLGPAYYKLVVTDGSCDGLNWWANQGTGITSGYIEARKITGPSIPLNGNIYSGTYNNDFGCGFTQYFTTGWPASVNNVTASDMNIAAYPNPAQNYVTVNITGMTNVSGTIQLIDALGRIVLQTACNNATQTLNTSGFANGVYTIVFHDGTTDGNKLQTRLVIAK